MESRDRERTRTRERTREPAAKPGDIPADWPNGSGLYREGTAHKGDAGLIGRMVRQGGGRYRVWAYKAGKYLYLGEYENHLRAFNVLLGR